MSTAFEDALKIGIESGDVNSALPSYMVAADTHNVANGNETFIDSAFSTIENIPMFIGVSLLSGANQLYNIAPDIGNLIAGEGTFERSDTTKVITELDSDLGKYYEENKQGADLVGFIASSLIPGTFGVKMLNAGQKALRGAMVGKQGTGMGKAMGLLTPNKQKFIDKATKEVATNSSAASLTNGNALKAVASGFGQNALEALAPSSCLAGR